MLVKDDPPEREGKKLTLRPGEYVISEVSTKVPDHRIEELLPLKRSEWQKIRQMLDRVKPLSTTFQNVAFASAGAFPTALTFLIGLTFVQTVPIAVWILAWTMTVVSPIVFLIAFIASRKLNQTGHASIEIVKTEMDYIEDQFEWPDEESFED